MGDLQYRTIRDNRAPGSNCTYQIMLLLPYCSAFLLYIYIYPDRSYCRCRTYCKSIAYSTWHYGIKATNTVLHLLYIAESIWQYCCILWLYSLNTVAYCGYIHTILYCCILWLYPHNTVLLHTVAISTLYCCILWLYPLNTAAYCGYIHSIMLHILWLYLYNMYCTAAYCDYSMYIHNILFNDINTNMLWQ